MIASSESAREQTELLSLEPGEAREILSTFLGARGEPGYRVDQILRWAYESDVASFGEMSNLPEGLRTALESEFSLPVLDVDRLSRSTDDTAKHLWRLRDGELIESVLIPAGDRLTLCISSQAGCAMACTFCATGWAGYSRQLTAGEIVAQYRGARGWARGEGYGEITNIVFMGMGEPLMNRSAVMRSLTVLNDGLGVGARRITVSTVGVVPGILDLAERREQFRLAVSLHAPNTELRRELIPVERKYPLPVLFDALRTFEAAGGKRITFEYVMIDGVNDHPELADELAGLIAEFSALVNLIPYNPIPGREWKASRPQRLAAFADRLRAHGTNVSVRQPRGRDIAAACGQLRANATTGRTRPVQIGG